MLDNLQSISKRLDGIENDLEGIKNDISEIKEDSKITRVATNYNSEKLEELAEELKKMNIIA